MAYIHDSDESAAVEFQPDSESAFDMNSLGAEFSSATVDAWASIRDGLPVADFEFAALAGPGSEPTRGSVLVGVGLGTVSKAGESDGTPQGGCVVLHTEHPLADEKPIDYVKRTFTASARAIASAEIRVEHTGPIELLSPHLKHRPAPGCVSLGHANVTAGTLGCLCRGNRPPRDTYTLVLSNNHVLANSNQGKLGDPVLQPGPADGGLFPRDLIGSLERFVPIHGSKPNWIDCATARVDPKDVNRLIADFGSANPRFFNATPQTAAARIGMAVRKSGRTTGLTDGIVNAVAWSGFVGSVRFVDQIVIKPSPGSVSFCHGGDSGALVWTSAVPHEAVGLLFAGNRNGSITFANPIDLVLSALDISLI